MVAVTDENAPLLPTKKPIIVFSPPPTLREKAWQYVLLCRMNGTIGIWLTFWPCTWGLLMAAYRERTELDKVLILLPIIWVGCAVLHSAACTINDIFDRELDAQVDRTKHRPLACGKVSLVGAWIFLVLQTILFVALLSLTNNYCFVVTLINLPIQFLYPLAKRHTYLTSFILGVTFSWGSLTGWSLITGDLQWDVVLPLYLGGIGWAMMYDTIYAHMDKEDDPKAGIKSTAILFGSWSRPLLIIIASFFVIGLTIAGINNEQSLIFFVAVVPMAALNLSWQLLTVDFDSPASCFFRFWCNSLFGWPLLPGLFWDYYTKITA